MHLVLVEPHPTSVADAFVHMALNMVERGNFTIWQAGCVSKETYILSKEAYVCGKIDPFVYLCGKRGLFIR